MMSNMHCDTIAQYKVYKWIKNHFDMNYLSLELVDDNAIRITDTNDNTAMISYKKNYITIEYSDGNKEILPINKIKEPCR